MITINARNVHAQIRQLSSGTGMVNTCGSGFIDAFVWIDGVVICSLEIPSPVTEAEAEAAAAAVYSGAVDVEPALLGSYDTCIYVPVSALLPQSLQLMKFRGQDHYLRIGLHVTDAGERDAQAEVRPRCGVVHRYEETRPSGERVPVARRYSLSDDFTVSPVYEKLTKTIKTAACKKAKKIVKTTVSMRWMKIIATAVGKNANRILKAAAVNADGDKVLRTV
jgi:hypothetical protein